EGGRCRTEGVLVSVGVDHALILGMTLHVGRNERAARHDLDTLRLHVVQCEPGELRGKTAAREGVVHFSVGEHHPPVLDPVLGLPRPLPVDLDHIGALVGTVAHRDLWFRWGGHQSSASRRATSTRVRTPMPVPPFTWSPAVSREMAGPAMSMWTHGRSSVYS